MDDLFLAMKQPGFLIDLDGTLYEEGGLLPGVPFLLEQLRNRGCPFCFVTNTTRMSRRMLLKKLEGFGLDVPVDLLYTAPTAAATWLHRHGYQRPALYLEEATAEDFEGFDASDEKPDVVVVGDLGEKWSVPLLNRAFQQLIDGADLVAVQKNRYWKSNEGLSLDAGPFVAALEYASGKESVVVGKPEPAFFEGGAALLGKEIAECVMVGDDIRSDVGGMQKAGGKGVLVRTGKFRPDDPQTSGIQPDMMLDSVADLVDAWESR